MPLITIIVPVYNLDKYLDKCLHSIYNQTYTKWECIIINDHSTDDSERIAKEWCEKDKRFSYIFNETNQGLSNNRNIGINNAKGEYIIFIDSDDWIEENFLQAFIPHIKNENTLLVQDVIRDYPNHQEVKTQEYNNENFAIPQDLKRLLSNYRYTQGYAWNKLFNISVIKKNNLRFIPNTVNEDEVFYFEYMQRITHIIFLENAHYHYIQREGSMSKTPKFEPCYNYLVHTIRVLKQIEANMINMDEQSKTFIQNYIKNRFSSIFQLCLRNSIYYNNYSNQDKIKFLRLLKDLLKEHKNLFILPKTLAQKTDIFLLENSLLYLANIFLNFRTQR